MPNSRELEHGLESKKRPIEGDVLNQPKSSEALASAEIEVNFEKAPSNDTFWTGDPEDGWGELEENTPGRRALMILLGVLVLAFVSGAVWSLVKIRSNAGQSEVVAMTGTQEMRSELRLREEAVERYLSSESVEERALYVRDVGRVLPLMREYYQLRPVIPEVLSNRFVFYKAESLGEKMWLAKIDGRGYLYIEKQDNGEYLVDWEADVAYQVNDWGRFIANKTSQAVEFRVNVEYAQLNGVHAFEFSKYNTYRCFRITVPGEEQYLWGYTKIGTATDRSLISYCSLAKGKEVSMPVILDLRYPENSISARYVHIDRLVMRGWSK